MKRPLVLLLVLIAAAAIVVGMIIFVRSRSASDTVPPVIPGAGQMPGVPADGTAPGGDDTGPTEQPIEPYCGDYFCDPDEDEMSCPGDCVLPETVEGLEQELYFTDIRPTSLKVLLKTNVPTTVEFRYGGSEAVDEGTMTSDDPQNRHEFVLEGMREGEDYYHRTTIRDTKGQERVIEGMFELAR